MVVARISIVRLGAVQRVTLAGRLSARDLKRLEQRCATALQEKRVPLELDLGNVLSADRTALAYLERLLARGARIVRAIEPTRSP